MSQETSAPATVLLACAQICERVSNAVSLLRERYQVVHAATPEAALACVRHRDLCLVIICDDMAAARAATLMRGLLPSCAGPFVLLADERHGVHEQVLALESGFDDVWPPLSDPRMALARVRALVRREESAVIRSSEIVRGAGLILDRDRRALTFGNIELMLAPREAEILACLLRRKGQIVERGEIGTGRKTPSAYDADVNAVVCRLRRKIRDIGASGVRVASVRGRGYTLRLQE